MAETSYWYIRMVLSGNKSYLSGQYKQKDLKSSYYIYKWSTYINDKLNKRLYLP